MMLQRLVPQFRSLLFCSPYKRNQYSCVFYNNTTTMQKDKEEPHLTSENNTALFIEGKAKIYTKYHEKNKEGQTVESEVFYNPVQVFNRDFSVLVMQTYINRVRQERGEKFGEGVTIVDALSASGLRTIRYLKQLEGVNRVIANDLLPASHRLMQDNFQLNKLDKNKYVLSLRDANEMMRDAFKEYQTGFDIIDLDPYGSVVPFLDAAVAGVREGGLLCITCTDTKVLCGPDLSKCFYFYGTVRAKVHDFNENALRILLSTTSSAASRHCKYIEPLMSLQTEFYVRVFVRVRGGKKECGESATKIGNIYNCQFCGNYESKPFFKPKNNHFVPQRSVCSSTNCNVCQHPLQLNGPVWLGRLNDPTFIEEMLKVLNNEDSDLKLATHKKIHGVLHAILAEKENSHIPLSLNLDLAFKAVHSTSISRQSLISAVKSIDLTATITTSYLAPTHYKTSLPLRAIYDIIKAWKLKQLGEEKYLSNVKSEYALNILKSENIFKPDFDYKSGEKIEYVPRFISLGKGLGPKGKAGKRVLQVNQQEADGLLGRKKEKLQE